MYKYKQPLDSRNTGRELYRDGRTSLRVPRAWMAPLVRCTTYQKRVVRTSPWSLTLMVVYSHSHTPTSAGPHHMLLLQVLLKLWWNPCTPSRSLIAAHARRREAVVRHGNGSFFGSSGGFRCGVSLDQVVCRYGNITGDFSTCPRPRTCTIAKP